MRRYRGVAVLLVGMLVAAGTASAAPLKATVRAPATAIAGSEWQALVTVTRAGKRVRGLSVTVRATRGSATRAAPARAVGPGVYRARLRLEVVGRWSYAAVVRGRVLARGAVQVRPAVTPPPPPPPPAPPPPPPRCVTRAPSVGPVFTEWNVSNGPQVHPHDIWPAGDGTVWYTGQFRGFLGRLVTASGAFCEIPLGAGSAPHGVIAGPDGDAWVTDMGRNSIIRVDRETEAITEYPVPPPFNVAPHTAAWDGAGLLWFTGIEGYVGRVDPSKPPAQAVTVWPAPRGGGPYGIDATPAGDVWFVSLRSGSYLGRIDRATGAVTVVEPPRAGIQFRRVWSDSQGRLWASEWAGGRLARYDPATSEWREWAMPAGELSLGYAITVDAADVVWVTDFASNALVRFSPVTETFTSVGFPSPDAAVRQIVGDSAGIWGTESSVDRVILRRTP